MKEGFLILLFWSFLSGSHEICNFPDFLQSPVLDGAVRPWITRRERGNRHHFSSELEVNVRGSHIMVRRRIQTHCMEDGRKKPCTRKDLLYKRTCLRSEGNDRYRVKHHEDDMDPQYTCMQFIQRSKSVVQVKIAALSATNNQYLCDSHLQRDDWPWILVSESDFQPCPLRGGFDFYMHTHGTKEVMCPEEWRPSRIESECINGEGIDFLFPHKRCNPFSTKTTQVKLLCLAGWNEDDFTYIVGSESRTDKTYYTLRFPRDMQGLMEVKLYFGAVTPITTDGRPPEDFQVKHFTLDTKKSDPGLCYDESEKCRQFAQEGKCTNRPLHEYANYCKKSCGLCTLIPSSKAECKFPEEYRGTWVLYETNYREDVHISDGNVSFSQLGTFTCKGKHWAVHKYKLLSIFNNGCRSRYTCLTFSKVNQNVLQFEISQGSRNDQSIHRLCSTSDNPNDMGDYLDTKNMKNLIVKHTIRPSLCGLEGNVQVYVNFPDGEQCTGMLSDWNAHECRPGFRLSLDLEKTCPRPVISERYTCLANAQLDKEDRMLITLDNDGTSIVNCWVLTRASGPHNKWQWRIMHKMPNAQCYQYLDDEQLLRHPLPMTMYLYDDKLSKDCSPSPGTRPATQNPRYASTRKSTERAVNSGKPQQDAARGDAPGAGCSHYANILLSGLLLLLASQQFL